MVANDERQKIMTANSLSDINVSFLEIEYLFHIVNFLVPFLKLFNFQQYERIW